MRQYKLGVMDDVIVKNLRMVEKTAQSSRGIAAHRYQTLAEEIKRTGLYKKYRFKEENK